MRFTARFIAAITIAASATATANAQQVAGEYIVDSQIISDVAVGEETGESHQASASGQCTNCQADGASGGTLRGNGHLASMVRGGQQGPYIPKQYAQPDLFYNYYSNGQNQVNAEMYLAPGPVPAFVGHTWVPYQPLMPHNYLYQHQDRYHNHYDYGRGTNRTKASYRVAPKQYAQTMYNFFRIAR
ncbi:hypothetical protein CA51_47990 [Rosistilla oblonga]|uniref:Cytochrome c domain-containing protein n=1 Tax=Rosistilla oblonga TaxID=2527990 RepID=A0A518IV45_9BACT|nr:hypothetical protein [Rosistilla oblonga]QDV14889.1 hypothetical protein CA51_47990 [Rosistilla oblonga]QDV56956.1 hypothetical protein Mal33_29570 [Rosistilla oblonga]